MPRTPEQIQADDALTKAILDNLRAYGIEEEGFVLGEYLVIHHSIGWDEDGDPVSAYGYLLRENWVPLHGVMGLLRYATQKFDGYARVGET